MESASTCCQGTAKLWLGYAWLLLARSFQKNQNPDGMRLRMMWEFFLEFYTETACFRKLDIQAAACMPSQSFRVLNEGVLSGWKLCPSKLRGILNMKTRTHTHTHTCPMDGCIHVVVCKSDGSN